MPTDRKHILILPKWYPNPSDIQLGIFVQNHASLISSVFDVTVLYVQGIPESDEPFLTKSTNLNGIQEIRVYYRQSRYLKKIKNFLKYRKAQKIGLKLIKKQVDLVHVQVPIRPALLALHLLSKHKIPFIVTEHWSGHLNGAFSRKSYPYRYFYKKILLKAAITTAVSSPLALSLEASTGQAVDVIPNFIKSSIAKVEKLKDDKIQIVSVSDLNNQTKNITGLIDGFKLAYGENNSLFLTIIGDGPDKKLINDKILSEGLQDSIALLGRKTQDEVITLIPKFHFYICNSNVETFGMTVAEAILAGLPVITTRCGGPEQFVSDDNGISIALNDSNALKAAILTLSKSYTTYNSAKNISLIQKQFGESAIIEKWEALYKSILI